MTHSIALGNSSASCLQRPADCWVPLHSQPVNVSVVVHHLWIGRQDVSSFCQSCTLARALLCDPSMHHSEQAIDLGQPP